MMQEGKLFFLSKDKQNQYMETNIIRKSEEQKC